MASAIPARHLPTRVVGTDIIDIDYLKADVRELKLYDLMGDEIAIVEGAS
jgi:hypothetical protein